VTIAPARDFTVLLPPGWVRIPLDGDEGARMSAIVTAKVADVPQPQREQVRQRLITVLRDTLRSARNVGGLDVLVSLGEVRGVPIAASCLVTYLERGGKVPLEGLHAELARDDGLVTWTEIAGSRAVRRRHADASATMVDFFVPVPGRPGLLSLSFGTIIEPLAEPLVMLFDAIAGSLRWQS
jgi:hypothetical protein